MRHLIVIDDHFAEDGLKERFESFFRDETFLFDEIEIRCFSTPAGALDLLASGFSADCIIVDFAFDNLEGVNGLDIARELDALRPHIPLVLYSNMTDISLSEFWASPFFDYLPKDSGSAPTLLCLRKAFELRDSNASVESQRRERERVERLLVIRSLPAVISKPALTAALAPNLLFDASARRVLIWAALPYEIEELERTLAQEGYEVLAARSATQFYDAVLSWQPVFIVMTLGVLTGERAYRYVCDTASKLRDAGSRVHVIIVCDGPLPFNESILPVGFSALQIDALRDSATAQLAFDYLRSEGSRVTSLSNGIRNAQATYFPSRVSGTVAADNEVRYATSREVLERCRREKRVLVTVNVKHPLMIPALILAASEAQAPICLEISPREAQQYWVRLNPHPLVQTRDAVRVIRSLIDFYRGLLGCKEHVLLHLDHATTHDLIQGGIEEGCDLVMFDGGVFQAVEENILLTQEVRNKYPTVVLEGEIHRKDRSHQPVSAEAVNTFISRTSVDLLGVWAGQLHGTDYDFQSYCDQLLELEEMEGRDAHGGFHQDYVEAIDRLLRALGTKGYVTEGFRGQFLANLKHCLISETSDANQHLLTLAISGELLPPSDNRRASFPLNIEDILHSAYQTWHPEALLILDEVKQLVLALKTQRRARIREIRNGQLESLVDSGSPSTYPLNLGILETYAPLLAAHPSFYGYVLHGGSSIDRSMLSGAREYGVVKANFGSSVYRLFIETADGLFPVGAAERVGNDLGPRKDLLKAFWLNANYKSPDDLRQRFRGFVSAVTSLYFKPCGW